MGPMNPPRAKPAAPAPKPRRKTSGGRSSPAPHDAMLRKPSTPRTPRTPRKPRAPRRPPATAPTAHPHRRTRSALYALAGLAGTLAVAALLLYVVYGRSSHDAGPAIEVEWPAGLGSGDAAALLGSLGVIESPRTMALFLDATGGTRGFVAGPHLLKPGASAWDLRRSLERSAGRPKARIAVPEGFHRFDLAARLERQGVAGRRAFLAATVDPALLGELGLVTAAGAPVESAEGYLFPATYDLATDSDPRELVRRMAGESRRRWDALSQQHAAAIAGLGATLAWGRHEILTLASIVEREAVVDEERPTIASVFFNRLLDPTFKSRRLQSDPTAMYGCVAYPAEAPSCADFKGRATPAINKDPANRYSTYARAKLPPGPIANPGVKSITAVLAPAATRYFYFVAAGQGRHTFSEELAAHNDAIQKKRATPTP